MIWQSVTGTVGKTPLVELRRIAKGLPGRVAGKLELRNPCASVKDRIGVAMVDDAERRGLLVPGATLVEPTSGNTGIALAFVAAARGYRLLLTMPETMSAERVALLRYLGADVVLTPGTLMRPAVERAKELVREVPGAVMLDQFQNAANPEVHRRTTAVEIWDDSEGAVDVFVAGVGTGGTVSGAGGALKERKKGLRVVAVEPERCAILSGKAPGPHLIQGLGAGFVPPILDRSVIDEVLAISDEDAFTHARRLAREEGIPVGISSGAALAAALIVARRPESAGKLVVAMFPDAGERYVTSPLAGELVSRV
jgi:cysteine synthase